MSEKLNNPVTPSPRHPLTPPSSHTFVSGYPGDVGGANTECWHTVRLWRRFGLKVTFLPTWRATPKWRERLAAIGCETIETSPQRLRDVPGLPGAVVVSFCNSNFLNAADWFRDLGCRVVWVGCMNWIFAEERRHYLRRGPFDRYVFQSEYQRETLMGKRKAESGKPREETGERKQKSSSAFRSPLSAFGVREDQCHLIRGAFCWDEFPFRPLRHPAGTPLVIGRISRAAADKYSSNTWPIYRRIPHSILARLMAWDGRVQRKLGPPPPWAECLPAGAESSADFLAKLHCMLQVNGGAGENWPRSGLEAMSTGVPIVVQNRWGWREMIRHGQTGLLANSDAELAYYAARLAHDEDLRMEMAYQARRALEEELANPEQIWAGWRALLETLA